MIIATDEIRTYAMMNYEKIDWITSLDNYDGMKGSPAYVSLLDPHKVRCILINKSFHP